MRNARDQRPYNVRYYATHRQAELDRVKKRQAATLAWLRDVRRRPCEDCGNSFPPYVLDFDHRDPGKKLFAITTGSAHLKSRDKLIAEIEKCDIVCANCHALRTYANLMERKRRSTRKSGHPEDRQESQCTGHAGAVMWRCSTRFVTSRARTADGDFRRASCSSITATPPQRRMKSLECSCARDP
jgi:hypothetical protein